MMLRNDCDNLTRSDRRRRRPATARAVRCLAGLIALSATGIAANQARAGSIRVWPSAVIVAETIRLDDLCELRGFDENADDALRILAITEAPPPGGSRIVHMDMIRSALSKSGINMAEVTLKGATRCEVSRPSDPPPIPQRARRAEDRPSPRTASIQQVSEKTRQHESRDGSKKAPAKALPAPAHRTLRQAVIDHFDEQLRRFHGTADVIFDRTSEKILDLSGPDYEFRVRQRGTPRLGVVPLEVDVVANGRSVQTVPMAAQVSMFRAAVIARRSINQGATVRPTDLSTTAMSFTRLDRLGVDDMTRAIGQRAKRFIPAGTLIDPGMLESVPLVMRGQLVTMTTYVGGVQVTTTAKAGEHGRIGELITVRSVDNKRVEFDAVVVGPGSVRVGPERMQRRTALVAMGNQP